ncbi:hypothetical protein I312_102047 [Cryptococcus bacillisporus CA1280]|uniref:uncharacterized protein n=1 Tax=Cryptococcus bacillisporus CA1280 TaxID=1296109 RepID=UPI003365EC75
MKQNRRDSPSGINFHQVAHVGPSPLSGSSSSHGTAHHPLRKNNNTTNERKEHAQPVQIVVLYALSP